MKKKILLFICLVTVASLSFAQEITQDWSFSLGEPRGKDDAVAKDLTHIDANGSTYVCGVYSQDFNIGDKTLLPIGNSSYLAKLDNSGKIEWAVALQGNVTLTYITSDSEGNIYVAGISDGDEVILESTNNSPLTIKGNSSSYGDYNNTIIAKYDTKGIAKSGKIILHDNTDFLGMTTTYPQGLAVYGDNVYLALILAGNTTIDGKTFSGSVISNPDLGMELPVAALYLLSFNNETLILNKEIASVLPKNPIDSWDIKSAALALSKEGNIYVSYVAPALQTITVGNNSRTNEFKNTTTGTDYTYSIGIGILDIDASDNLNSFKAFESQNEYPLFKTRYTTTNNFFTHNQNLIIVGEFQYENVFDSEALSEELTPFFVIMDNNYNKQKVYIGPEGNSLSNSANGNALLFSLYNSTEKISTLKAYDFGTQNVTDLTTTEAGTSINGVASTGAKVAISKATAGAEVATLAVSMNTLSGLSGINSSSVNTIDVKVYPNPVTDVLNFSEVCDVTITNIQGSEIKVASTTTQIAVADLAAGYYVAKIKTSNGIAVIPFIKK